MGPKQPICPEQDFLVQTIVITFIYLLDLLIVQNLKKFLKRIQNYHHAPFWGPKRSICPKFFLENYYYYSHLPISTFHCAKFKQNSSCGSRVMRMCNLGTQNGPFPQIKTFSENPLISLVSFIRAYLHAKNQIQILI